MKKIITLLLLTICFQFTKAQMVTIPDANFVAWLQTNVPSAMVGNQMDTTSLAVTTCTIINVENLGISDITGVQYFDSLKTLDCGNGFTVPNPNTISSLPHLPSTLDSLICGSNSISVLPLLPNTLKTLRCYSNQMTILNSLPSGLMYLDCSSNGLTSLPNIPNTLIYLNCNNNYLTNLPLLPNTLLHLSCGTNNITSYPVLPNSLIYFACFENQLTSLPILPINLETLWCGNNLLTTLPSLPPNLQILWCDGNQISNLPVLPSSLIELWCGGNLLTALPSLPSSLKILECMSNQIISLPFLPSQLVWLECSYNQLTSLPPLPGTLHTFKCSNNSISCFAPFNYNIYAEFDISGNPFTCLPNYIGIMNAATLNYPLCVSGNTLTNPNNCPSSNGIVGFTFKDNNSDCIKNTGDVGLKNIPIQIYDNANNLLGQTYTALNGVYQFNQTNNLYTVAIDTLGLPFMASCINPGLDSLVSAGILETNINFALTCKPSFDIGVQSIVTNGIVFPGQIHELSVSAGDMTHWYNLNCASGVSGTLSFFVNGPVTYIGPAVGSLTPTVVGNVYTYTISDFGTINNANDFKLIFQTNTNAQAGDAVCINAIVTPTSGDNNLNNNSLSYCYTVINSHDPNIKEVYPVEAQQGFNDWLTYTIHFQNTGNAAAINIRLEDELDAKLNTETFEVINYSHNNVIDLTGNHLTVRFPNIQLADSNSNPTGSIGFIQYRIKPKANWISDTISNTASIYFDYNLPIITNTAKSYFMSITSVNEQFLQTKEVNISPNPTNGLLTITSKYNFEKIELSNVTGQVLLSETVNDKTHQLQLQNFAEGIYFVKIVYDNGMSVTKKVVKQ